MSPRAVLVLNLADMRSLSRFLMSRRINVMHKQGPAMFKTFARTACAAAAVFAVPATAATVVVPLGVMVVPPTTTWSPGVNFTDEGANSGLYEFTTAQAMTLTVSSFTNSAFDDTGRFDFSTLGLYSGLGTGGTLLQMGTVNPRVDGTQSASLSSFTVGMGTYTIAYTGTVMGAPASVGSSITFGPAAVPEPAGWAMMIAGFGLVGGAMRASRRRVSFSA